MRNIWFTADTHFRHAGIIQYCNRPFDSVQEMDEEIIARWNSIVASEDFVYHLGDLTLGNFYDAIEYLKRLNGLIYLIPGGHDARWIKSYRSNRMNLPNLEIFPGLEWREFDTCEIVLCHYAMRVWEKSHYGSFHLYGHSHGTLPSLGRSMDVGMDTNNFYPYSLEEIVKRLSKIEPHNKPKEKEV